MNNVTSTFLEGIISVDAAIRSKKRKIIRVLIDNNKFEKRDRKITRLVSFLKSENIPFYLYDRDYINSICESSSHGGVVAEVGEYNFCDPESIIGDLKDGEYAVMLDGVEDPFNFGYSIRNLYAFGCKAFIIPERNWMSASNIVSTSSAGSSEMCDMAISKDDNHLVDIIKKHNIEIVCSALSNDSIPLYTFKPKKPFILFIGGEKRGISKNFMENASTVVHIPYENQNAKYSLPTASCAAIFGSYLSSL